MNEKEVLKGMEKEMEIMEDSLHHLHILCSKMSMLQEEIGEVFLNRLQTITCSKENFRNNVLLMYNMLKEPDVETQE